MAKFGLLVADRLAVNQETSMLRTPKKPTKKAAPKLVAMIKNGHTDAELDEMEERWVNHEGPYMTLVETLSHAAAQAAIRTAVEQTKALTGLPQKRN